MHDVITARQDSGISNHRGEHSGVIVVDDEDEPRAILTPRPRNGTSARATCERTE